MISIKDLLQNFEKIKKKLLLRNVNLDDLEKCREFSEKLKEIQSEKTNLNFFRNKLIKENLPHNHEKIKEIKQKLLKISSEEKNLKDNLQSILPFLPNIPDDSLFCENKLIEMWGEKKKFDFKVVPHWDLGEENKLFDLSLGSDISGSGFVVYVGIGAKLFQSLIEYTISENEKKGYIRYFLPVIVNKNTLFGTSQLPKFEDDLFKLDQEKYLSPTSETQLVNLYKNKIIKCEKFPIKLTSNTNCFRLEAGGAGADTRGIIRLHQFNKTEIVVFCEPENSSKEHENMLEDVCNLLRKLNLPYQVIQLSYDDMSFSSTKTYDIEVWFPSENRYREISSISNTLEFQSRRAKIRYKKNLLDISEKAKYPHILNGSALAIDRLFAAILENYQNFDKSINIPEVLQPYLGIKVIKS